MPAPLKSKLAASRRLSSRRQSRECSAELRSLIELLEAFGPNDIREEHDRQTALEYSGGLLQNSALIEFESVDGDVVAAANPLPDSGTT